MKTLILTLILTLATFGNVCENTYKDIVQTVTDMGFTVTSTTTGRHNKNSKHYLGKAVDVRTRDKTEEEILNLRKTLETLGYVVIDERERQQGVWSGPHLHVHIEDCVGVPTPNKTKPFNDSIFLSSTTLSKLLLTTDKENV